MTEREIPVGPGTEVSLTFSLKLATGELVDSTGEKPAALIIGDGNLLPGFEQAMFGLKAGDHAALSIQAEQGFGPHNEENLQRMKRRDFSQELALAEGLVVSFANEKGEELPGVILEIGDEYVEVDFNHPLAGKDLLFEVTILSVRQVSDEIVRM
jgi:FKBP-type peptidyl-prolyl cis-trans isomerase SlpA